MSDMTSADIESIKSRISAIDAMFENVLGWGSWMVECANEREMLVEKLRKTGIKIEHKNLARTAEGGNVS